MTETEKKALDALVAYRAASLRYHAEANRWAAEYIAAHPLATHTDALDHMNETTREAMVATFPLDEALKAAADALIDEREQQHEQEAAAGAAHQEQAGAAFDLEQAAMGAAAAGAEGEECF